MKKSQKLILAIGLVLSVFLISFVLAAVPTECSGGKCYRIDHGETIEEVSLVSVVYDIINQHGSNNYFIPTNTEGEFSAFKAVASSLSVLFSQHIYCIRQTSCSDSECGSSISDGCGGTIDCPACPVVDVLKVSCTGCIGECGERGSEACVTFYTDGSQSELRYSTCLMPDCSTCTPYTTVCSSECQGTQEVHNIDCSVNRVSCGGCSDNEYCLDGSCIPRPAPNTCTPGCGDCTALPGETGTVTCTLKDCSTTTLPCSTPPLDKCAGVSGGDSCSTCNGNTGEWISSCTSSQICCDGTCYENDPCYDCGLYQCTSNEDCTASGCMTKCYPCEIRDSLGNCNYQCNSDEECVDGQCQLYLPLAGDEDPGVTTAEDICAVTTCGDCESCSLITLDCVFYCDPSEYCHVGMCLS